MRIRYGWELALAALLVIEIVAFGAINPRMLDLNMLLFSTSDFICIGIVALPLTMVIVSGGIDISFGSTIGLCAIALGVLFQSGVPMPLAILLTLLLGALCGLINAGLIIYTKVNPLVITLGTLYLFAGSALLLSGMAGATGYEGIGGFPMAFTDFANLDVLGLPVPLIIFLICLLVFWLWLHKTHAGRNVFLIGQSPRVALYRAIPVNRTLCALYAMTGLASAVAAVLLVSYFGSARSDLGASFLMPAITAVVLGGANIYGGSGSIIGTAIAVLLVGYFLRSVVPPATNKPVVLRASGANSILAELSNEAVALSMDDAVRLNSCAVAAQVYIGSEYEHQSIKNIIQLVDAGMKVGMPTMAVTGVGKDMVRDQRYFSLATRIAAEMGAQIIKTYYVEKGFERIVAGCPVPIVIAGGKKLPEREALEMCWQAIDQGASGVDMGRNIFQSDHPVAMMKAVQAVVHHNETATGTGTRSDFC
ncbi:autoinducer 2 ABC transporter permease LsrD [Escherichia coli]|nr:autoinducer 2 ABC transporter permease LsrD [Escherichia coli]